AAKFHHFVIAAAVANRISERRGGRAVSRNKVGGYAQRPHLNHVTVKERPIHVSRWITRRASLPASPSVRGGRRRYRGRIEHPVLDIWNFTESRHQRSAGLLFHVRCAARLITVIVIDEDGFDIRHFEAHALDVLLHGFGGVCRTRTHHDVTLRRG